MTACCHVARRRPGRAACGGHRARRRRSAFSRPLRSSVTANGGRRPPPAAGSQRPRCQHSCDPRLPPVPGCDPRPPRTTAASPWMTSKESERMPAALRRNSHLPTFPMMTGTCEGCTPGQVTAAFRLPYKGDSFAPISQDHPDEHGYSEHGRVGGGHLERMTWAWRARLAISRTRSSTCPVFSRTPGRGAARALVRVEFCGTW